tara:strand:+ start:39592 stop:39777 length:186 start_codon:yes stop_codon:yes gene_type:complete
MASKGGIGRLEVVILGATSIIWDHLFDNDRATFQETVTMIRNEGAVAFANGRTNIIPLKIG